MRLKAGYFVLMLFAVNCFADEKGCYIDLTGSPYCISRANAGQICKSLGATDAGLMQIKKCLNDFSAQFGGMSPQVQTMCLMGFVRTGDPQQDSSNCTDQRSEADTSTTAT